MSSDTTVVPYPELHLSGGEWFTQDYFDHDTIPFEAGGALHVLNTHEFVDNWETGDFQSTDTMFSAIDQAYEEDDLYVQLLHYQYFTTDERLEQLRDVIQHIMTKEGVGCMKLGEFGTAYLSGEIERTRTGWRYEPTEMP